MTGPPGFGKFTIVDKETGNEETIYAPSMLHASILFSAKRKLEAHETKAIVEGTVKTSKKLIKLYAILSALSFISGLAVYFIFRSAGFSPASLLAVGIMAFSFFFLKMADVKKKKITEIEDAAETLESCRIANSLGKRIYEMQQMGISYDNEEDFE